jgi:cation transport regulator ChaB
MNENNEKLEQKKVKITVEVPKVVKEQLKQVAKQHYRSFNGELIFAIEWYLMYWQRQANAPKEE